MSTLVIVEHDNSRVHSGTLNTLTAALQLQREVILFVIGYQCQPVAEEAAKLPGVTAVWVADDLDYAHPLAENLSELIVSLSASFSAILAPASTFGKNLLPRIAARLNVTQVSDVSKILNEDTFEHPIYAGNAIETVRVLDDIKVLGIRTTAFDAENRSQPSCPIETINRKIEPTDTKFIKHELSESKRPELGNAKVVVAGGRGLQNADNFKLIEALADALGGAVGASRAAVDAGYVSNDYQVGQTGKVVAPTLYFAVGISGAIQHIAGMKDARIIVAINKDPEAPIFQIATYSLVGDLFEVLPQLIEALKKETLVVI